MTTPIGERCGDWCNGRARLTPGPRRSGGFTFIDLVVSLLVICLLTALLFGQGVVGRTREIANRVKCGVQLRQIGQGLLLYANENRGNYPRTFFKPGDPITQYTGVDAKDP